MIEVEKRDTMLFCRVTSNFKEKAERIAEEKFGKRNLSLMVRQAVEEYVEREELHTQHSKERVA